ncbi:HAD family hydrolase [Microaerobacter geothermalis]|uniref:HAD family hydrolase n=1 Tax=Microaerobacter geothermalis TaxID=674972 RepID=UPI001F17FACD|nr:HAD family hydrolase [Microaerobacter geothermalis]MCF6094600.1 HAD family hydrolase [Microaerobacter geothermalis]
MAEKTKAILFDLDGTLLPMDTDGFIEKYLQLLAPRVAHIIEPKDFVKQLWASTHEMIKNNDPNTTNEQVFTEHFLKNTHLKREIIWPIFDHFYREIFPILKEHTNPTPLSRNIVETALDRGYKIAIATNPVFPREAIVHRMRWAEVDDLPFDWVTVYEESHFCKPNPNYYIEVANQLNIHPENCIMVGNDIQEDMVAGKTGMRTYLVRDYLIDRGNMAYHRDDEGSLEDLHNQLATGKSIFS